MLKIIFVSMVLALLSVTITGCGSYDSYTANSIPLPTDSALILYCADVGVYPEKCVLNDPGNPYRMTSITNENKFALSSAAPSAKARFYVWATALAQTPAGDGEDQFYVASSLHELYTVGKSDLIRRQAFKAYSTVLGNAKFRSSSTYWKATWLTGQPTFAVPVKDWTGMRLYDPRPDNFLTLFPNTISDPALSLNQSQYDGLQKLGGWRCAYDPAPNPLTGLGILTITGLGIL